MGLEAGMGRGGGWGRGGGREKCESESGSHSPEGPEAGWVGGRGGESTELYSS